MAKVVTRASPARQLNAGSCSHTDRFSRNRYAPPVAKPATVSSHRTTSHSRRPHEAVKPGPWTGPPVRARASGFDEIARAATR
jgi:hypothetical protein